MLYINSTVALDVTSEAVDHATAHISEMQAFYQ